MSNTYIHDYWQSFSNFQSIMCQLWLKLQLLDDKKLEKLSLSGRKGEKYFPASTKQNDGAAVKSVGCYNRKAKPLSPHTELKCNWH